MALPQPASEPQRTYRSRNTSRQRLSSDRSDLRNRSAARNVRTSSMPGAPKNSTDRSHQTIDEQFSDSYAEQGIRPQGLDQSGSSPTQNKQDTLSQPNEITPTIQTRRGAQAAAERRRQINLRRGAVKTSKKAKALRVTWTAGSVCTSIWLLVQMPLAIMTNISFGLAVAVHAFVAKTDPLPEEKSIWDYVVYGVGKIKDAAVSVAKGIVKLVDETFGIDLTVFDPMNLFLIFNAIMLAYAIVLLLIIYLVYTFLDLEPLLAGKGGAAKTGAFLMCFIGYTIPLINIVPWVLFWLRAIYKNTE